MERIPNFDREGDPRKESKGAPVSLKRSVGVPGAVALLIGTMIGSGIFATPKWVLMYAGSVGMSLMMWALCGLIALFGALCYCELGTLIPKSGGEYAYFMAGYGGMMAFLYSYVSVLFVKPSGIMILLVFGAYIIEPFFPGCGGREDLIPLVKILAAAALGIITFVNCVSVKWATRMQIVFTAAKMIAMVMLIVTGLVRLAQGHTSSLANGFNGTTRNIAKLSFAFYNGLYPYDGWNQLNYFTEEIKNPNRVVFAAAREGHLPRFLAMIHTKRRTPIPAMIFTSIISFLMLIPDSTSFELLLNYFSFFGWLGYGITISSLLWFRYKRPHDRRPYKVWIGIPILMVLVSIYLVIAPIYEDPLQSLVCVLFICTGIPFYLMFVRYRKVPVRFLRFVDRVTLKLQKICDVAFPESEDDILSF